MDASSLFMLVFLLSISHFTVYILTRIYCDYQKEQALDEQYYRLREVKISKTKQKPNLFFITGGKKK